MGVGLAGHADPRERAYGEREALRSEIRQKRVASAAPQESSSRKLKHLRRHRFFTAEAANASHPSYRVHGVFSQIRGATQVQLLLDPHLMRFNSLAAYS